jgi:hypothetical protein
MNRVMSQGQATLSTWTCERVIQSIVVLPPSIKRDSAVERVLDHRVHDHKAAAPV